MASTLLFPSSKTISGITLIFFKSGVSIVISSSGANFALQVISNSSFELSFNATPKNAAEREYPLVSLFTAFVSYSPP